jgi:hypothetical protein
MSSLIPLFNKGIREEGILRLLRAPVKIRFLARTVFPFFLVVERTLKKNVDKTKYFHNFYVLIIVLLSI